MPSTLRTVSSALVGAALASAHGFVEKVVINGAEYSGYLVNAFPYQQDPPVVIGWGTSATDTGFVAPDAFGSPDIICHRDGANAQGYAEIAAGDSIFLKWNTWPESHKGPVIDYLAACGDAGCADVDKTTLEFFKISEAGLVDGSSAPGVYASDELIDNSLGWMTKIPENIAPGDYVLRHEIIALHSGGDANGAQNYPQCFNLRVTGSGTETPAGVVGTSLYTADEDGILFSIYSPIDSYPIPGPALIAGAADPVIGTSAVASTATATVGGGSGGGAPTAAPTTAAPTAAPTAGEPEEPTAAPTTTAAATSVEETPAPTPTPTGTTPPPTEEEPEVPACPARRRKTKRSKKNGKAKKARRNTVRA